MKLVSTSQDALGVDPRTKNNPRPAADNSNDNSPPFDGVLSDVGSDTKAAAARDSAAKTVDSTATAKPAVTADTTATGNTILDALNDLLGNGAPATEPQGSATKGDAASEPDADGDSGVNSLLKRIAGKDDDGTAAPTAAATAPPLGAQADMMSILLLGVGGKATAPAAPTTATATATPTAATAAAAGKGPATTALPGALDDGAKALPSDVSAQAEAKDTIVTDVAVSTHLAPAQTAPGKTLLADDTKSKTTASGSLAGNGLAVPAVGAGHAHGNDAGTSSNNGEASASASAITLTPTAMGADFAPVRSIATAIGELAAPAAPAAAAAPEAPKAALGVARTMILQMTPSELGTVDIRLHVTGQTLDVQLTVSDTQTLGLINRDRDTLATALHDQNYTLNSLVIQDGGAAASSGGNNGTQGDTSGNNARADRQSSGGGSDTQGGGGGGRQGGSAGQPTRDDRRPRSDTPARASINPGNPSSGSLYV